MKRLILALLLLFSQLSFTLGQSITNKLGIGLDVGGQKIYCDYPKTKFVPAIEAYVKYPINERYFVTAAFGYSELSNSIPAIDKNHVNNTFNFDIKGSVKLITSGVAQPYAYAGLGVINFHPSWFPFEKVGFFDATFIAGGGLEYQLRPNIDLNIFADYRFTSGDDLDDVNFGANDGLLNIRGGITYYLSSPHRSGDPKVLAEKTPLQEIEDIHGEDDQLDNFVEGIDDYEETAKKSMTMDQYIQLKSRVDQLNEAILAIESKIENLKAELDTRRARALAIEQRIRSKGGALSASLNMDINDFSKSYEKGLENSYARNYDEAIYIFNTLLELYPNHPLASNCRYWVGECYFGLKNYESAIESFNLIFNYENSPKKDDALLMLGQCYLQLGDHQLARQMFDRLINEYPESEYLARAENYIGKI